MKSLVLSPDTKCAAWKRSNTTARAILGGRGTIQLAQSLVGGKVMDEPPPGYDEDLESSFERRHAEELDMLREWEDSFPKIPGDSDQWPPEVTPGRHGNCLQPQRLLDENPLPQELISKKKSNLDSEY